MAHVDYVDLSFLRVTVHYVAGAYVARHEGTTVSTADGPTTAVVRLAEKLGFRPGFDLEVTNGVTTDAVPYLVTGTRDPVPSNPEDRL